MACSNICNTKILMSQYILEMDIDSTNHDLTCTICKMLMIDAYQTYCGCHYCHKCIVEYLADGDNCCLGGKDECKEENIILDVNATSNPLLNKRILKVKVRCPNKPCLCITELTDLADHLSECAHGSLSCPFSILGCTSDVTSKIEIITHLHEDTLMHTQLSIESFHNLKNEIYKLKEDFSMSKIELSNLREELREKDIQINEVKREIHNRMEADKLETKECQRLETKELKLEIERLKGESETKWIMMEDVMAMVTILKKELEEMREYSRNIKNTVEMSERESTKYRDETRSTLTKMKEETEKKEDVAIQLMDDMHTKINILSETIAILNAGTNTKVAVGLSSLTFDRFNARKSAEEVIVSPYFYSHANGYKLRLRVFPGGNRDGRGTHMSVFFRICRGEYDDVLPWPCRHTIDIGIANQSNGETHTSHAYNYGTVPDNLRDVFYKPISEENRTFGHTKFVSHSDLQSVSSWTNPS